MSVFAIKNKEVTKEVSSQKNKIPSFLELLSKES